MEYIAAIRGKIDLQATLAMGSATNNGPLPPGHHPITCKGILALEDDGTFRCPHYAALPGDRRTQHVLNQSIALLLMELVYQQEAGCTST